MKKLLMLILALGILIGASNASFAGTLSITLDSIADSGGDYTNGFSWFFSSGVYEFTVADGAWNAWGVTNLPDKGWMWSMDIFQPGTSTYYRLGNKTDKYDTADAALAAHMGEPLVINQPSDGFLWFFVKDGNPGDGKQLVGDNIGTVTANVTVVPEPISCVLFAVGGSVLGLRSIRKKRKL